jgi:hypothetical protein
VAALGPAIEAAVPIPGGVETSDISRSRDASVTLLSLVSDTRTRPKPTGGILVRHGSYCTSVAVS